MNCGGPWSKNLNKPQSHIKTQPQLLLRLLPSANGHHPNTMVVPVRDPQADQHRRRTTNNRGNP